MVIRTQKTSAFPLRGVLDVGLSTTKHNQLIALCVNLSNIHDNHGHQYRLQYIKQQPKNVAYFSYLSSIITNYDMCI